ncbi:G-protein coupled receptor GRL101-like [Ostrea edulis]|uniref:G-protein coupled receptor GRL101-like n=1 Tax=Ostrea edulis TaxID=37623 RepID=UPI0024AEE26E|nr:G-protein coupled receptor GRL101-like [Ostrea edulis]
MIREIDNRFVLRSARNTNRKIRKISDVLSGEIPHSKEHHCLRYKHLVIGKFTALVVGFIKDYLEPFDLSHILNVHDNSPVIKFSSASATLPVGGKFKVVFRALYDRSKYGVNYGLALISNVSISSGICEMCDATEFSCSRSRDECIPLNRVCDVKPDCLMEEDEKDCVFDIIKSQCRENNTSSGDEKNKIGDVDKESRFIPQWHSCPNGNNYSLNYTEKCSFYCPPHCACHGLSLNCSSIHNLPTHATSITLHGLVGEMLIFNERFTNLKKLQITSCESCVLYIHKTVAVNTVIINNSEFQSIYIDDVRDNVRQLTIFNSFIGSMNLSQKYQHRMEWNVQNSSLNATKFKIKKLLGNRADMSQTRGFPNLIERFDHLVVNYSSCNLAEKTTFYIKTITLDLSRNKLKSCKILCFTQKLYLQYNLFETVNISIDTRQSEARIQYLDLSYNQINVVETNPFNDLPNLLYLKLNKNRIVNIHKDSFSKLYDLFHLDLSNNQVHYLTRDHFIRLTSLQYLNLQNNQLNVKEGMFDGLISVQYLLVDHFALCCAQPKAESKIQCLAPVNEISSCDHLIDTPFLGIVIWYIALVAVFGNLCGILFRYIMMKRKSMSSFALYSINLGVADFLMGVYLYILAGANLTFSGRYGFADEWWRHSPICTIAGVMATLSSETSALFVLLITIDRIHMIRSPFSKLKENGRIPKFLSGLVWTFALLLSVLPLLWGDYFHDYYSGSGVCISLPLSVQRKPGWEYSMIIFVGANFLIFIGILIGQVVIFTNVVSAGKKLQGGHSTQNRNETSLAKILIAVAVTDLLCWIPLGTIGLLTFVGVHITPKVYAWVVVVVLPINSALNPLIYTFSAIIKQIS